MNRKVIILAVCLLLLVIGVSVGPRLWHKKERPAPDGNPMAARPLTNSPVAERTAEPVKGAPQPVCVDLKRFCTATLFDSLNSPTSVKSNNLVEFPKGHQTFGEVPFVVEGVVQLTGKKLEQWGRREFPEAVTNIAVRARGRFLHLLHGAGGVFDPTGETIARLVLHYADQTTSEIQIQAGLHVSDWWGNPRQKPKAPNSELIWTGKNDAIGEYSPKDSLRVYLTAFENPKPEITIERVDYLSTMKNASPFLLGLTLSDHGPKHDGWELNTAR